MEGDFANDTLLWSIEAGSQNASIAAFNDTHNAVQASHDGFLVPGLSGATSLLNAALIVVVGSIGADIAAVCIADVFYDGKLSISSTTRDDG